MKICGDGTDFHRGKLQYKQKSMSTPTVFENLWKSVIQYSERSELRLHYFIKKGQKNGLFCHVFVNLKLTKVGEKYPNFKIQVGVGTFEVIFKHCDVLFCTEERK